MWKQTDLPAVGTEPWVPSPGTLSSESHPSPEESSSEKENNNSLQMHNWFSRSFKFKYYGVYYHCTDKVDSAFIT